ncbi:MAG: hypothetical protein N3A69_10055 [Leptospiraceae bacterium]|nr:hypothetical protein [Leptospiraceae bacterium]
MIKKIIYYNGQVEDEVLKRITNRLRYGAADDKLKKEMELEEEILLELENLERKVETQEQLIQEKEKELEAQRRELAEKDRLIQELMKKLES